jgi:hypothetical protein
MEGTGLPNEKLPDFFYPQRTTVCSQVFSRFLVEYHENLDSFFFLVRIVGQADEGRVRAAKALAGMGNTEDKEKYEKIAADPDRALRQLTKFSRVQSRNLTNAAVNGFQRYFSEIIQAAILKKPESLRSSETVRIDEVLRFRRYSDLVSFLVDKKINELSYGGIRGMEAYFRDRLGIEMFSDEKQRALLTAFIEIRNINVHNGGIVNDLFLNKVGKVNGFDFDKGKAYHVDMDTLVLLSDNAVRTALDIDQSVAKKFKLQRKSHMLWVKPSPKKQ